MRLNTELLRNFYQYAIFDHSSGEMRSQHHRAVLAKLSRFEATQYDLYFIMNISDSIRNWNIQYIRSFKKRSVSKSLFVDRHPGY